MLPRVQILLLAAFLTGCGEESASHAASAEKSPSQGTAVPAVGHGTTADQDPRGSGNPYGFEVWHQDFPGAPDQPHLSPRNPGKWYDRTRRQALEKVVANLQGNCSRDAWLFAKTFFARVPKDKLAPLIDRMDRALQVASQADLLENIVEAMGHAADPSLAGPLLRALEHPKASVRNKVTKSMVQSGDKDNVLKARFAFDLLDTRGQIGWIRAARVHLGEEVVPIFQALLSNPRYTPVHRQIVEETMKLSPELALSVFEPFLSKPPAELAPTIAALRHVNGDGAGTTILQGMLDDETPQLRVAALQTLALGGVKTFVNRLTEMMVRDPDPAVRLAALYALNSVQEETVDDALDIAVLDESLQVRQAALAALRERGRRGHLDDLIEIVRTGTGSKVELAMADLIAAKDGAAVPAMAERMAKVPPGEKRRYVQAIALTTTAEALVPLTKLFLSDRHVSRDDMRYLAYMMANARGAEFDLIEFFESIRTVDYVRRAMLMNTLGNVAADREDGAIKARIYGLFRKILRNRDESPQIRLLALEYLRRDLGLGDFRAIRPMLRQEKEPMRKALTDFLFEFF